jgi:hypothetical protein
MLKKKDRVEAGRKTTRDDDLRARHWRPFFFFFVVLMQAWPETVGQHIRAVDD